MESEHKSLQMSKRSSICDKIDTVRENAHVLCIFPFIQVGWFTRQEQLRNRRFCCIEPEKRTRTCMDVMEVVFWTQLQNSQNVDKFAFVGAFPNRSCFMDNVIWFSTIGLFSRNRSAIGIPEIVIVKRYYKHFCGMVEILNF